uniref:Kinesin light chain n=1 Tax=Leptobrachium leishanense TaxID=445787 RepID=A0A8C5QS01_9ANUR
AGIQILGSVGTYILGSAGIQILGSAGTYILGSAGIYILGSAGIYILGSVGTYILGSAGIYILGSLGIMKDTGNTQCLSLILILFPVVEEKSDTSLLLGLCLDSYGRYLTSREKFADAQVMYEKALQICREEQGELHPQTVTLLNDLATVLDAQGHYEEAYNQVTQALELAKKTEYADQHMVLTNVAVILMIIFLHYQLKSKEISSLLITIIKCWRVA